MPLHKIAAAAMPRLLRTIGRHSDGGGLYLQVSAIGRASWAYQFSFNGSVHWMGLGERGNVHIGRSAREAS